MSAHITTVPEESPLQRDTRGMTAANWQLYAEHFWSAVAERSADTAFAQARPHCQSGVALRFPPHSITFRENSR